MTPKDVSRALLTVAIGAVVFAVVLVAPVPRALALGARYGIHWFVLAAALLWTGSFHVSRRWGDAPVFAVTLGLFGLALAAPWLTGTSDGSIIGGLLPWSDASGYYYDARRLNWGARFSGFSGRHPIFPGWLAVLLALTHDNLQWSLALLVAINATACFLLARAVRETEGNVAGMCTVLILFLFYRRFAGTTLTENAGVALGALGLAVLWRWASTARIAPLALGIFLTALALNARAGAFFVLPFLLLWLLWRFRHERRRAWQTTGAALLGALLAFGINGALGRILAPGQRTAFSNFSWTLYGQAVGGKGWTQVMVDHPELIPLPDPQRSPRIYRLAIAAIRKNPWLFVRGSAKALVDFVDPRHGLYIFSFIRTSGRALGREIGYALVALVIFALGIAFHRRQESRYSLLLFVTAGVIVSVPFVPPFDADLMRAYGASLPILGVVLGVGVGAIVSRFRVFEAVEGDHGRWGILTGCLILVLLTVSSIGPAVTRRETLPADPVPCNTSETKASVILSPGSYVQLVSDDDGHTRVPSVRRGDFLAGLERLGYPMVAEELARLPVGGLAANTFDVKNGQYVWLEWEKADPPSRTEVASFCGRFTSNEAIRLYGFFRADRELGRLSREQRQSGK